MSDLNRRIEAIWRIESPRLIATLARLVRDVGLAEELAQDAFVLALEQWPVRGVPDNPGGWLTATARHKAVDAIRREQNLQAKYARLAADPLALGNTDRAAGCRSRPADRRRPAGAALRRLPPGAATAIAGGADPAAARRPDHRGDRAGLSGAVGHDRPADLPREADAVRSPRPVRDPGARGAAGAAPGGARGALSDLQRGLLGHLGRSLAPAGPGRGGDAARPGARRPDAARVRGRRTGRADGAAGLPFPGPGRLRPDRSSCSSIRTGAAGTGC